MSKVMGTTSLSALLGRIAGEYRAANTIYGIPSRAFARSFELEAASPGLRVMGGAASLPVGPAAGPNSQIAPCLVAAYLAGARVFELKTVQENDALDIEKPCIYALDEGHNAEWSTELALPDARGEYLRGWIAVNLLAAIFSAKPRSFFFNMSVGYTLDGIKGAKVDDFIEGMRQPSHLPYWTQALRELGDFVESSDFRATFGSAGGGGALERAGALLANFPDSPVHSVTLSTMHGCPPTEIERIGSYLIENKNFDVYVKLNPTLVGYDRARGILDKTGWKRISIKRESFEHDLQFPDALKLVASLSAKAEKCGRLFGVKLSNTLANANDGRFLPGTERYMSGRALFPITVRLAAELAAAMPDFAQRFSYCGGASALNAAELIKSGVGPLTVATDILKPGGYLRLSDIADEAARALPGSPDRPDAAALERIAEAALERSEYRAGWKSGNASISKPLPLADCFAAPCVEACPVHQKAPAYIRQAAAGASREALATILADNPLPFVTGTLCDHVCQEACSRNDYEGPVEIRACKLNCANAAEIPAKRPAVAAFNGKVAVIGAGPGGLSCAYHLALAGIPVTVFDKANSPGGVPANVIPRFRISPEDIAKDIDRVRNLGVEFRFGVEIRDLAILAAEGYVAFFAAPGASKPRDLKLAGSGIRVIDALEFLKHTDAFAGARHIVVAGGGNTAMDAVRAATRLPNVDSVRLSYRRSVEEMPADKEELGYALAEAATLVARSGDERADRVFMELSLPERAIPTSAETPPRIVLRKMRLGEPDASGRRAPIACDETEEIACDLLIAAVGEFPDGDLLKALGAAMGEDGRPIIDPATQASSRTGLYVGGDAARGPASIIAAAADGRRAAFAIMRAAGIESPVDLYVPAPLDEEKLASRGRIATSLGSGDHNFIAREAERCLACDSACLRCVEVCPNRANTAIAVPAGEGRPFAQGLQILHLDYLCNECGNCGLFCPYEGKPYLGKPTLFQDGAALVNSRNAGFAFAAAGPDDAGPSLTVRARPDGKVEELPFDEWETRAGDSSMEALALAVLREHSYLIGAAR
jgi:putative selenate reductase